MGGADWSTVMAQGFEEWNQVKSIDGSGHQGQAVQVTSAPVGPVWTVQAVPHDAPILMGAIAATYCGTRNIYISNDLAAVSAPLGPWTQAKLRAVASHEMSHALGLGHTGRYDNLMSYGGIPSRTTTCLSAATDLTSQQFTPEDRASLIYRRSGIPLANPSFEDLGGGAIGWATSNASLFSQTGGGHIGPRYAYYLPTDTLNNHAVQRQSVYNWSPNGVTFSAYARKATPQASGEISMQVWARRYNYASGGCPAWPTDPHPIANLNANGRSYPYAEGTDYALRNFTNRTVASTWQLHHTTTTLLKGNHNAVDLQVRVTSNVKHNGSASAVHFDNARLGP